MKPKKPMALLLPANVAVVLLLWACWILYTGYKYGRLPVAGWETEHRYIFGTVWLVVFLVILLPAYVYAMALGVLALLERNDADQPQPKNYWPVAVAVTVMLILITFCARVAVTAWFPSDMHAPLSSYQGGMVAGFIATIVLGAVLVTFYRVAMSF